MRLITGFRTVSLATVVVAAALSGGQAFAAAHVARPTILAFLPPSGSIGTRILISGTNFKGATSVTLNGVKVPFKVDSAMSILATIPAKAKTGKVTVVTKGGKVTSKFVFSIIPNRHV